MKNKLIAANWKMNLDSEQSEQLFEQCAELAKCISPTLVICPPATYLQTGNKRLANSGAFLGAQNVNQNRAGAFTGELSANMLKDCGCKYVIVGHSERRAQFGENDELVAEKVKILLDNHLIPILCIGESETQRHLGLTDSFVTYQIDSALALVDESQIHKLVIAYEPIWAIGTNKTASITHIEQTMSTIVKHLINKYQQNVVDKSIHVLYGGSVSDKNCEAILSLDVVDGCLVGGASLDFNKFEKICRANVQPLATAQ
ncbi:triose-phosphate isomerase [Catenovulum adriaticum]|uniref:Triosephosphate isomerase n=1 Tax=Catenovulum adriaticum TaxID=2984846 RepID=A0ABY7ATW6_9ALTE|nr:triose-phosphate isomerase [Catenovulum sp. TS8]WAJ71965.1 triose-phosphate isomerase [Catenovulum sp. TS8]